MKQSDKEWLDEAKASFDESVDSLDAATLSRLNRGRQAALQAASSTRSPLLRWMPATGVAAAMFVAVMMFNTPTIETPLVPEVAGTDFEILLGEEDIEFLEELEFYSWLGTMDMDEGADVG